MHLASACLAGRMPALCDQLRHAVGLRFRGLAVLPWDPRPVTTGVEKARRASGADCAIVGWQALAASASAPGGEDARPHPPLGPEDLRMAADVLGTAHLLGARILVVAGGTDVRPELRERSARLLARQAQGDAVEPDDEAVEELRRLVLPARERRLEDLARFLFALRRTAPDLDLALVPEPDVSGLLDPSTLAGLLEDPALAGIGYWHDCAVVQARSALGLEHPGQWLDRLAPRLKGTTLSDWAGGREGLPPGEGVVDWPLVADYLPRRCWRVLSLAPAYPDASLAEARSALEGHGIR